MRRYETIYILRPAQNEEQINTIVENTNALIGNVQGQIIELNKWGMKKLAYPIKKETQGFYVFCDYSATPEAVAEIERKFRIDDAVLRYMTVKTADSISDEEIAEATNKVIEKQESNADEPESADTEGVNEDNDADDNDDDGDE